MTPPEGTVLLVEDEPQMRKFVRASLSANGYRVLEAERGAEVAGLVASHNPDVVLLDLGLPDGDGIDVARALREWSRVPIIVLSARGRDDDKVAALDAGADDYLTKPFSVRELLARLRVAQRHAAAAAGPDDAQRFDFGELHVDVVRREVTRAGQAVKLTPTEYKLLLLLARNAGRVLTRRYLLEQVWGSAYAGQTHSLRVHMAQLRKKVEPEPSRPRLLITEPGVGYRLREPPT